MTVYLIKKKKGRVYKSEEIMPQILENEGLEGITLSHGSSGEPLLSAEDLHVSLSDTSGWWACVISESGDVGLDIEEKGRKVRDNVVKKLHRLEQQYLSGLEAGSSEWTQEFLNIWTRKEAYSKFCSAGLSIGFGKFSAVDRVLEYSETVSCQGRPEGRLTELSLPSGLTGALCTPAENGTPDIYVQLLKNDGKPPVPPLAAGMDMLSQMNLSTAELSAKLQKKGYTKEEADGAAAELESRGYIDNAAYAVRQASLAAKSGKSQSLIKRQLAQKGLSSQDIDNALEDLAAGSGENEYDRALAQAVRLLSLPGEDEEKPDEKKLAKLARRLSSLGYAPGIIYSILDKYR